VDFDNDGIPDGCDPCPLDFSNDSDGDGVCDSNDICPGFDDTIDTDGDGIPDGCDDPLEIQDFKLSSLSINPNPFKNSIIIHIPNNYRNNKFNIYLFDLNGRLVFEQNSKDTNGFIILNNLDQIQAGVYFIKIDVQLTNGESVLRRLLKY
jgi:hypothetical protein